MYKVYFKDRIVYFGDDFSRAFERNKGLFYRFSSIQELHELIDAFFQLREISVLYIFHDDLIQLLEEFKACFTQIDAGGGLVFNQNGEFLVIYRNGVWDLPKGKLERGEGYEEGASREVLEETGLKGLEVVHPIMSTYHTYQLGDQRILKKTKWYEMRYTDHAPPVLQAEEGITDFRWVKPGETDFIRKNTYPSIIDVLFIRELL